MLQSFVTVGLLVASAITVAASPTTPKPKCSTKKQLATFDDLDSLPLVSTNPVPDGYKGLLFQAFNTAEFTDLGVDLPGVIPHSGDNYAGITIRSLLRGNAMITTNFPESNTTSFSLDSFYYGCVVTLMNTATAVPAQCIVNIAGYKGLDNSVTGATQVCSRQFQYNPSTALGPQQLASTGGIPGCKDVQFVMLTVTLPGGLVAANPLLALVIDDVALETKTCE